MSARPFRLTYGDPNEGQVHRALAKTLRVLIAPPGIASPDGVVWFSIEQRTSNEKERLERSQRGVIPGVRDLVFHWKRQVLYVEAKAPDGDLDTPQRRLAEELAKAGVPSDLARDQAGIIEVLRRYGVPHRRAAA
jgi:hypothetical protein